MDIDKDAWLFWYSKKQDSIDEGMPQLADFFKSKRVSKILDLGCGAGRHTVYIAKKGFEVYGFDFSSYAIKQAKRRLEARRLTAHLTLVDMRKKFPYKDEFFDAIVTIRVIHHARVRVIKHIFAEIERTLKKGGYFFAQLPTRRRTHGYDETKHMKVETGTNVPLEGPEKGIPHHGFTKKEISKLLKDFEIEEIREKDLHFHILAKKKV